MYRIGRDGILTVLAGTSSYGFSGDNGSAVAGRLAKPSGVVADAQGNVFIADTDNQRIRKVTPDGIIRTIAGTGMGGFSGDNGQALATQFNGPAGLALDAANNLYVADQGNNRVRRISPDGIIRTVANVGSPGNLTIDGDGNLYIAGGPRSDVDDRSPSSFGFVWFMSRSRIPLFISCALRLFLFGRCHRSSRSSLRRGQRVRSSPKGHAGSPHDDRRFRRTLASAHGHNRQ
ncbi:MAG: hypothetical protein DMG14_13325 [Acidobacteria bacterium]|nr:MAG: hypothetical protein DMG14_13325 [Acidobacteriota bacterium]